MSESEAHSVQQGEFIAAVLAGGEGKRLGMDKALLNIDGSPVIDRIIHILRGIFPLILLVVQDEDSPLAEAADSQVRLVTDVITGKGPLVGLYTALQNSPAPYVFIMACDMPYPSPVLIRCLLAKATGREAVVPRRGDYIEPLFAVYSRDIGERIRARIAEGRLKIHELIREMDVAYVEEEEIATCDPRFLSFFNINTPEDLEITPGP